MLNTKLNSDDFEIADFLIFFLRKIKIGGRRLA